jgi:predicted DNA-binding transcriptional regulator YafY
MRLDRLLAITVMLINRDRIPAKELADHFEVTVRTIYRDVEAINLAGIPVITYQGTHGGLGIMENYRIDRQVLTLNDIVSIVSVLKGMNRTFQDKKVDTAIEKITNLVPKDKTEQVKTQMEQLVIDVMPWGYGTHQKEVLSQIQLAISQNKLLKFTYHNTRGEKRLRTVEPMTLLFKEFTWYVFGYCRERKDYRLFRRTRMKNMKVLKHSFERREQTYHDFSKNDYQPPKRIPVVLKFSPRLRYRVEDYYEEKEIRVLKDGSIIAKSTMPVDDWIYSLLLSFGEEVEVIQPLSLRMDLKKKLKNILERY